MFTYRTWAMIAVSMVIAAPALVLADFQHFSLLDDACSRTELVSVPASERGPQPDRSHPLTGFNQFAKQ